MHERKLNYAVAVGSIETKRPCWPRFWNFTTPLTLAKRVSSLPRPTLRPGFSGVPRWRTTLGIVSTVGLVLFAVAYVSGRRRGHHELEALGKLRRLLAMARAGLHVMRSPGATALAISLQIVGWTCQLLAVYTAMRAFDIHAPMPAAGVVLLVMNVVTIIPFWPGNIGLVQVAIASALTAYAVPYATGVAYGFGLQAIEASVGIGVGLLFLAREGLSFAMLRVMPTADQAELPELPEGG